MTTGAASNRPELRAGKLPRNTALLYRKPGKHGRPSEYIGVLKLSREVAKVAAGAGLWITVLRRAENGVRRRRLPAQGARSP
jgi:hypothetical protein